MIAAIALHFLTRLSPTNWKFGAPLSVDDVAVLLESASQFLAEIVTIVLALPRMPPGETARVNCSHSKKR